MALPKTIKLVNSEISIDDINEYVLDLVGIDVGEGSPETADSLTLQIMEEIYEHTWQQMKNDFYNNNVLFTCIKNEVQEQFDLYNEE